MITCVIINLFAMKTIAKSTCLFVLLSSSFMNVSCENKTDIDSSIIEEEYIEIGLNVKVPEVTESPMAKSSSSNDLYGVEIYEAYNFDSSDFMSKYTEVRVHASGVFSSLDESIRLIKNKTYFINILYIPNGKNLIQKEGNGYGMPFGHLGPDNAPVYGEYKYGGGYSMNMAYAGISQVKGQTDYRIQANMGNEVDIYYGGTTVISDVDTDITIDLYRQMCNVVVDVQNLTKGKVHLTAGISYQDAKEAKGHIYTATSETSTIDKIIELQSMPWMGGIGGENGFTPYSSEYYENWYYEAGEFLKLYYEYDNGDIIHLFDIPGKANEMMKVKRMTKYSFSFDINDYIDDYLGTVNANIVEDNNWSEE